MFELREILAEGTNKDRSRGQRTFYVASADPSLFGDLAMLVAADLFGPGKIDIKAEHASLGSLPEISEIIIAEPVRLEGGDPFYCSVRIRDVIAMNAALELFENAGRDDDVFRGLIEAVGDGAASKRANQDPEAADEAHYANADEWIADILNEGPERQIAAIIVGYGAEEGLAQIRSELGIPAEVPTP